MSDEGSLSQLRVPLERLQRLHPIRTWKVEVRADQLEEVKTPLQIGDVFVPSHHLVVVDVVLAKVSEGVAVNGTVVANWVAECSRCLRTIEGDALAQVEELFEENPREGESYPLGDEFLDLAAMVREAVLLELPVGVVRCPNTQECLEAAPEYASANRKSGDEAEDSERRDPRWAALDELTFEEE
ncbi:MAG: YceD family protein [Actinomycetota bacterium]|nr:YceD family protein [Actinomycetota bacterium]MEC9473882.1 YceD family protein [Actinomycetota bacterium]MEE3255678.1 YceD family protein [Actinomycetota bacterium]